MRNINGWEMFIALITPDFFFSGLQTTAVGVDETRG